MSKEVVDIMNDLIITQMAANLAEAAARNGASFILDKIKAAKTKKDNKETINELEEIIFDLLADKAEIQRIAQAYEQELVSQKITEEDIKYITENLLPIFSEFIPNKVEIEQLKKILSVETLTIMQLIGFNYKQAIGEQLNITIVFNKFLKYFSTVLGSLGVEELVKRKLSSHYILLVNFLIIKIIVFVESNNSIILPL